MKPALAALALVLAAGVARAFPDGADETLARDATAVLQGDLAFGAGVVVTARRDALLVLTAWHVAELGVDRARLAFLDEPLASPDLVLADAALDLAVLSFPLDHETADAVAEHLDLPRLAPQRPVRPGDVVHPLGHPEVELWSTPRPAPEVRLARGLHLELAYDCRPGSSGGGVFDADWRLAGVMLRHGPDACEVLRVEAVLQRLRQGGIGPDVDPPWPRLDRPRRVADFTLELGGPDGEALAQALVRRVAETGRRARPVLVVGDVMRRDVRPASARRPFYAAELALAVRVVETAERGPAPETRTLYQTGSGATPDQAWDEVLAAMAGEIARLVR